MINPGPGPGYSGDIEIPVLMMSLFSDTDQAMYLDNRHGNHTKVLDLGSCELTVQIKKALLGLHAFTGNHYISASSNKERKPTGPCTGNIHSPWTFIWNLEVIWS